MHYCLYCIARGQNRKKSDSLIFFFSRKLELLFVIHCVLSENLLFVVFTFQKKEKKRDTARVRSNNCSCTKEISWKKKCTYFHNSLLSLFSMCLLLPFLLAFSPFINLLLVHQTCLLFSFLPKKKKKKRKKKRKKKEEELFSLKVC